MSEPFVYLPEWKVLLCTLCGHCLQPRPDVWVPHLRQQPHGLRGAQLKSLGELFGSYTLAAPENVGIPGTNEAVPTTAIHSLRVIDGWQCLTCTGGLTRNLKTIKLHVSKAHQQKPSSHKDSPLWRACKLQTFFAENRLIRYFVVAEKGDDNCLDHARPGQSLGHEEERFFQQQVKDVHCAKEDSKAAANIVQGFDSHRSAVMP